MESLTRSMAVLLLVAAMGGGASAASLETEASSSAARQRLRRAPVVTGGHDRKEAWMAAEYRQFHVRKRTDKAAKIINLDLAFEGDVVSVRVAPGALTVSRGGRKIVVNNAERLGALQQMLGGSAAVFAARAMLSELESVSELKATDMSVLTAAAFVASLVGDVEAPRRLADRFVAKHRGIYQQIRRNGGCWSEYSTEATSAWDDLQACMSDADERGFFRAAYERIACNAVWLLRSESAWLEYLNCLGPLSALAQ